MSSKKRGRGTKESRGVPTQWSEWEWNTTHKCWRRYRLDAYGEYEFDYQYDDSENTNVAAQSSTIYPSSSVAVSQSSIEDLNAQYQGLDVGTSRERGRNKSRENREDQPRDPSVSPARPVKPGPKPAPFPQPQNSSAAYDSSGGYYGASPASPIFASSTAYPHIPTVQYGSAHGREYDEGSHEPSSLQDYDPTAIQIIIKRTSLVATISSSKDSFISSAMVDHLKLKRDKIRRPWTYRHPDSGKDYEIRETVTTTLEPAGRAKMKDVQLYVLSRKCNLKNPVVLGTGLLEMTESSVPDCLSSDSGYATASSRRPSVNQPTGAHPSLTYTGGQESSSSPLPAYQQPVYAQNLPSVQETPSSSYPKSSYPTQAGKKMSYATSTSHRSHRESYAAQPSTHNRNEDFTFSTDNSGTYSGMTGESGAGDGGMRYDFLHDDDNYSLHSDSHTTRPASNTPRPTASIYEAQNVYSPTSDDTAYSNDYVTRH